MLTRNSPSLLHYAPSLPFPVYNEIIFLKQYDRARLHEESELQGHSASKSNLFQFPTALILRMLLFLWQANICLAVTLINWSYFCWLGLLSKTISGAGIEQLLNTSHMLLLYIAESCKPQAPSTSAMYAGSRLFSFVNKFSSIDFPQMTHLSKLDYFLRWIKQRNKACLGNSSVSIHSFVLEKSIAY